MKWNESSLQLELGESRTFEFCGFDFKISKAGKKFEIIKLDCADGSFWIPLFKVLGANITLEQARKFKGQVVVSQGIESKYDLEFILGN